MFVADAMMIRKYQSGEESELWNLFYQTIHTINVRDYTQEQVAVWASDQLDEAKWRSHIEKTNPYVCEHNREIIGYADLQKTGYIDHFYVHHQWQSRGVGKLLFSTIEAEAQELSLQELSSNVSITARPFFASRGFIVVKPQEVVLANVVLQNFKMIKKLRDD